MSHKQRAQAATVDELLPFPFAELRRPVSDLVLGDALGPILAQSAGLAATCCLAMARVDSSDEMDQVHEALKVLQCYLQTAVKLFDAWTRERGFSSAPSSAEEDQP